MSLKSGHRIIPLFGEEAQKQHEHFLLTRSGTVRLQPDGWFFTTSFIKYADNIYNFKFKPNDVVIMTFPKCGTTWMQEIVWTMFNNPNLDNPQAKQSVKLRCPFLEYDFLASNAVKNILEPGNFAYDLFVKTHPDRNPEDGIFLQLAEFLKEPRIMKTHLPISLLSPSLETCKVIYVARNPKDIAVSYWHHARLFNTVNFIGSISELVDHFIEGTLVFNPYWTHLKEAWNKRNLSNFHYCFFEDMKADPEGELIRIQKFLEIKLTEKQVENVLSYTTFEAMKARDDETRTKADVALRFNEDVLKAEGGFFRKGEVGDWKAKLSNEDIAKLDDWTKKNTFEFDDDFKYKIN